MPLLPSRLKVQQELNEKTIGDKESDILNKMRIVDGSETLATLTKRVYARRGKLMTLYTHAFASILHVMFWSATTNFTA